MKYKKTTLPNGLRIIAVPTPGNRAAAVMILTETGSKHETKEQNGLSHFLEHMLFKGTHKRKSASILHKELDSLGAQANAMTDQEYTAYYAKAEKKQWKKVLEILSDMYLSPLLPVEDLDKERGVILQEISMYEDLPQRQAIYVLLKLMYGDTPAGRTVLGPAQNIRKFSRYDFVKYHQAHYVPSKTVVVVAGDLKNSEVQFEVKKYFADLPKQRRLTKEKVVEKQRSPEILIKNKKTDQMHLVFGLRTFGAGDKRGRTASMLAAVLGGGFSSRLFEKMRDEMGACYYVRASHETLTDHGVFSVSIGIDPKRDEEVIRAIIVELKRLKNELVSDDELKKVKDYVVSHMFLNLETTDSLAEFYAVEEVIEHKLMTPSEREKEIRAVTAKDIQKVAKEIFQNKNLNLAIVGDIKGTARLKNTLKL